MTNNICSVLPLIIIHHKFLFKHVLSFDSNKWLHLTRIINMPFGVYVYAHACRVLARARTCVYETIHRTSKCINMLFDVTA